MRRYCHYDLSFETPRYNKYSLTNFQLGLLDKGFDECLYGVFERLSFYISAAFVGHSKIKANTETPRSPCFIINSFAFNHVSKIFQSFHKFQRNFYLRVQIQPPSPTAEWRYNKFHYCEFTFIYTLLIFSHRGRDFYRSK